MLQPSDIIMQLPQKLWKAFKKNIENQLRRSAHFKKLRVLCAANEWSIVREVARLL
jgi:hypothetical protein